MSITDTVLSQPPHHHDSLIPHQEPRQEYQRQRFYCPLSNKLIGGTCKVSEIVSINTICHDCF